MSQVSDYDIANASGAAVRSDINLVLDAVKTLKKNDRVFTYRKGKDYFNFSPWKTKR